MMKKAKFTVIDAFIIVFVIAVLSAALLILKPEMFKATDKGYAEFTVLVSKADEGISNIINVGDEASISFSENAYAIVTGVSEEQHKESEFNKFSGSYVYQPVEGKCDLKIELKCEADITDTCIDNNGVPIRVGSEMPVRGKGYTVKGYVIEVEDR